METTNTTIPQAAQITMFGQPLDEFLAAVERQVGAGKRFATPYAFAVFLLEEAYELTNNDERDGARWALNKAAMLVTGADRLTQRDGTREARHIGRLIESALWWAEGGNSLYSALDTALALIETRRLADKRGGS